MLEYDHYFELYTHIWYTSNKLFASLLEGKYNHFKTLALKTTQDFFFSSFSYSLRPLLKFQFNYENFIVSNSFVFFFVQKMKFDSLSKILLFTLEFMIYGDKFSYM